MRKWPWIPLTAALAVVLLSAAPAAAESFPLELKRLEPLNSPGFNMVVRPEEYIYRMTQGQSFFFQPGVDHQQGSAGPKFAEVIKKQPEQYNSKKPLRAVAELGDGHYGFVLDTPDADSDRYTRLLFDLNHNGDLTDDEPYEAKSPQAGMRQGYWNCVFPRIDLAIQIDGEKADYSFSMTVFSQMIGGYSMVLSVEEGETVEEGEVVGVVRDEAVVEVADEAVVVRESSPVEQVSSYISVTLQSAAYRQGEVELNGKTRKVVLLDFNSNGRFDDPMTIPQGDMQLGFPEMGDLLLFDPQKAVQAGFDYTGLMKNQVAKVTSIDGKLYDLVVSPGGDRLELTVSSIKTGFLKPPTEGFSATLFGELGMLTIEGDQSQPLEAPAGTWRLYSYTLDMTEQWKKMKESGEAEPEQRSLLEAISSALLGSASSSATAITQLQATAGGESQVIEIVAGQTIDFPFTGVFKPVVTVTGRERDGQTVQLNLSLVGAGGERCTSLLVEGGRPEEPSFTISTLDGEEVASGVFEWG